MKFTASSIFVAASALLFSLSAAASVGEGAEGFNNRNGGARGVRGGSGVGRGRGGLDNDRNGVDRFDGDRFPAVSLGTFGDNRLGGEEGGRGIGLGTGAQFEREPVRVNVNVKADGHRQRYGDYDGYQNTKYYYPIHDDDNGASALWAGNAIVAAAGMALLAAL